LLIIKVCGYITIEFGIDSIDSIVIGIYCDFFACALVFEVTLFALTLTEFPNRIGLQIALVTDIVQGQAIADT
jgi:hypothetical protein